MTQPTVQTSTTTIRNGDLATVLPLLSDLRTRALDLVVPARDITVDGTALVLDGTVQAITLDGVTTGAGRYDIGDVATEHLAAKLGVSLTYLRRMRTAEHADLFALNTGYWLARDERSFLLRVLRSDSYTVTTSAPAGRRAAAGPDVVGGGFLRAVLGDRYRCIDNIDAITAVLAGLTAAEVPDPQVSVDLTERRMYVRITSQAIAANALALVSDYRHGNRTGRDYPMLFAGIVFGNSEVGNGLLSVTPRVTFEVCTNGQTMTKDAWAKRHVGAQLDEGEIDWSDETRQANLKLITAQVRDMTRAFMTTEYLEKVIGRLAKDAGKPIEAPERVIKTVSQRLGFSDAQREAILSAFIGGGTVTAGGVMHAVTSVARDSGDGDVAAELEAKACDAMVMAAAIR